MPTSTRGGGSLPDPTVEHRVVQAVLEELAESGRANLSMDRVAKRAGVSKTTVYTRWSTKEDLLVAAYRQSSRPFPALATGTLRGDLDLLLKAVIAGAADNHYGRVLTELLSAAGTDPSLQPELQRVAGNWNTGIQDMLQAGLDRGELDADTDVALLTDAIISITLRRLLFRSRPIDATLSADIHSIVFRSPPRNITPPTTA